MGYMKNGQGNEKKHLLLIKISLHDFNRRCTEAVFWGILFLARTWANCFIKRCSTENIHNCCIFQEDNVAPHRLKLLLP